MKSGTTAAVIATTALTGTTGTGVTATAAGTGVLTEASTGVTGTDTLTGATGTGASNGAIAIQSTTAMLLAHRALLRVTTLSARQMQRARTTIKLVAR